MEKTSELERINHSICNYYQQHNNLKKDNLFCFSSDKKDIADFYGNMNDHIFQSKVHGMQDTDRKIGKERKIKERIMSSIKNPLLSALPKQLSQNNLISVENTSGINAKTIPMFSGVERSKKGSYEIC
jgi:hypothetical protein